MYLLPDHPVTIKIVSHGRSEHRSALMEHTTLFTVECTHAHYTWKLRKGASDFLDLHDELNRVTSNLDVQVRGSECVVLSAGLVFRPDDMQLPTP